MPKTFMQGNFTMLYSATVE